MLFELFKKKKSSFWFLLCLPSISLLTFAAGKVTSEAWVCGSLFLHASEGAVHCPRPACTLLVFIGVRCGSRIGLRMLTISLDLTAWVVLCKHCIKRHIGNILIVMCSAAVTESQDILYGGHTNHRLLRLRDKLIHYGAPLFGRLQPDSRQQSYMSSPSQWRFEILTAVTYYHSTPKIQH